jgi:hypothetical protein
VEETGEHAWLPEFFCEFLSVNLKREFSNASLSVQPILPNHKFAPTRRICDNLVKRKKKDVSLDETEVVLKNAGEQLGATAMTRPTGAEDETSLAAAPRRQLVGGFAERNEGFLGTELLPRKDGNRKNDFFQRGGSGQRAKEEAAFQDEEMTEPTSSRNIPNQLQYYQKTAADPRQFFILLKR